MNGFLRAWLLLLACGAAGCGGERAPADEVAPFQRGPYPVASTNLEVSAGYTEIGDEAMHDYLLGRPDARGRPRFLADILEYPESAWIVDVPVPDDAALYGPASGLTLPVVVFVTFPTVDREVRNPYPFPYHDSQYGVFEDMLGPAETPRFADPAGRYPLVIVAHGAPAHGLYDVAHAHDLASHGFIVAVVTYGDDRTVLPDGSNSHTSFLRPLLTHAVVDSLLDSETFGAHIDADNIGITGHSFGGFTALAAAGGPVGGNPASVGDARIKAGVLAAPWVGGKQDGRDVFAFGPDNTGLERVSVPMICLFGTKDESTTPAFILPAMKRLSGPTYVVELVDQPHIFESGSWVDRNNWELLFFEAYLQRDPAALERLETARSMPGGNVDYQLFDYQKPGAAD